MSAARVHAAPRSLLVMPVKAQSNDVLDLADQLTSALAAGLGNASGFRVVAYKDLQDTMTREQVLQFAGCDATSCASEVAGALNAEEIVIGTLSLVAQSYQLALSRVRARDAAVLARYFFRTNAGDDPAELLKRIPDAVRSLLSTPPEQPTASPQVPIRKDKAETPSPPPWKWVARGGAGLAAAVGLVGLVLGGVLLSGAVAALLYDWQFTSADGRHALTSVQALAVNVILVASALVGLIGVGLGGVGFGVLAGSFLP